MADEDSALAKRVRYGGGGVAERRLDEDEVRLRGRVFEAKLGQLILQPDTLLDDVLDDLAMVVGVFNRGFCRDDGQPVDVVGILHRVEGGDQPWASQRESDAHPGECV